MDFQEDEIIEILNIFREESEEQIQKINKNLLRLEANPKDSAAIVELFREAHSIKGAARMIGFNDIQTIAHKIEDIFGLAKEGNLAVTSEVIDILCSSVDYIGSIIEESIRERGQTTFDGVAGVVEKLEYVKSLENTVTEQKSNAELQENSDKSEGVISHLNSTEENSPGNLYDCVSGAIFNLYAENVKVLFQVKSIIDRMKSSPDSNLLKELTKHIQALESKTSNLDNFRLHEIIKDIKMKLEVSLKGSGALTSQEVLEIETKFNTFTAFLESLVKTPDNDFNFVHESKAEEPSAKEEIKPEPAANFGNTEVTHVVPEKSAEPSLNTEWTAVGQNYNHKQIDFEGEINYIKQNITRFSVHSPENIVKFDEIVEKINVFTEKIENNLVRNIIEKISELLIFSKDRDIPINPDILQVVIESFDSAVSMIDKTEVDSETPVLIVQRLAVLYQMIKLSASENQTFVEEDRKKETDDDPTKKLPSVNNKKELLPKIISNSEDDKFSYDLKKDDSNTIKTLRVDTNKLDQLVSQVGELIIAKIKAKEHLFELEKMIRSVEDWHRDWNKTKQYFKHIDKSHKFFDFGGGISAYVQSKNIQGYFEENSVRLAGLMNRMNLLYKTSQEDDTRLDLIVNELEEKIKSVRVLPLATIFHMFPRMVRDIARERNKNIELIISGSETSVDKKIIEEIKSPLIHIVRNSIDHGIEDSQTRVNKGKNPIGKILLAAYPQENSVLIEIVDDGRGIDVEAIKRKVLQKQLLTEEELEAMSEEQIMNIIFWPGFSTGETVTDISGRGIGLDIVYTKISQLNGKVKIKSVLGESCKVSIQLPVTMATIKSFLVEVNKQKYAIPTSAIVTTLLVSPEQVFYKEGKKTIIVENRTVPICNLCNVLELPETPRKSGKLVIIVIQSEDVEVGFVVDKLLGDQEILHKNLSPPLLRVRNIAGLTILGSGELCMILNINDLVKSVYLKFSMPERPQLIERNTNSKKEPSDRNILVVDDSLTTRILERNLLKAAGYNVTVAVNGLEALTKVVTDDFDLVITDAEMPEINGFELIMHLRGEEKYKNLPIILLTSLASESDRKKGLSVGANAYLTKGDFNQEELLSTIKKLLG